LDQLGFKFILCCRSDRPSALFTNVLHKNLKKDEWNYLLIDSKIFALSYSDRKICNFLSNIYGVGNQNPPEIVQKYNKYKGSMDQADAHWNRYLIRNRTDKWTKATFFAFMKMALVNSWILYSDKCFSQRHFMERILFDFAKKLS